MNAHLLTWHDNTVPRPGSNTGVSEREVTTGDHRRFLKDGYIDQSILREELDIRTCGRLLFASEAVDIQLESPNFLILSCHAHTRTLRREFRSHPMLRLDTLGSVEFLEGFLQLANDNFQTLFLGELNIGSVEMLRGRSPENLTVAVKDHRTLDIQAGNIWAAGEWYDGYTEFIQGTPSTRWKKVKKKEKPESELPWGSYADWLSNAGSMDQPITRDLGYNHHVIMRSMLVDAAQAPYPTPQEVDAAFEEQARQRRQEERWRIYYHQDRERAIREVYGMRPEFFEPTLREITEQEIRREQERNESMIIRDGSGSDARPARRYTYRVNRNGGRLHMTEQEDGSILIHGDEDNS